MIRTLALLATLLWAALLASACFVIQPDPTEDNLYAGLNATARFYADPDAAVAFNEALWAAQNERDRDAQAAALAIQAGEIVAQGQKHEQSRAIADRWLLGIGIVVAGAAAWMTLRLLTIRAQAAAYRAYLAARQPPPGYGMLPRTDPRFHGILIEEGGYYSGNTPMMDGQEVTSLAVPLDRLY